MGSILGGWVRVDWVVEVWDEMLAVEAKSTSPLMCSHITCGGSRLPGFRVQ